VAIAAKISRASFIYIENNYQELCKDPKKDETGLD
jgi:hypothetical protein